MANSIYQPLTPNGRETRLITIQPSDNPSTPIECTIRNILLDDPPRFTGLSYAWGDPKVTALLYLNGSKIQVTTNLESALRTIRDKVNEADFWVDAICINQNDLLERNHQVQLMRDIYSRANVLVWLGEEKDNSDLAMDRIEEWGTKARKAAETDRILQVTKVSFDAKIEQILQDTEDLFDARIWHALGGFSERSWWRRLWVLQEVVVAKDVTVMCGYRSIPWDYLLFYGAICTAMQQRPLAITRSVGFEQQILIRASNLGVLDPIVLKRSKYLSGNPGEDLWSLLQSSRSLQSAEPSDKVYGLLGLARDAADFASPDYTQPFSEVYRDVATRIIQRDRKLDVLRYGGVTRPLGVENIDIPSWIPDWRGIPQGECRSKLNLRHFLAASGTNAVTRFSPFSILFAHGVVWDRVSTSKPEVSFLSSKQNWDELVFNTYPTGIPQLQAFFRTILLDRDPFTSARLSPNAATFVDLAAIFLFHCMFSCWNFDSDSKFFAKLQPLVLEGFGRESSDALIRDAFIRETLLGNLDVDCGIEWHGENGVWSRAISNLGIMVPQFFQSTVRRSFFVTKKGYMGLGPPNIRDGDLICVLLGLDVPLILRKSEDHYLVIGESFVLGLMYGEALQDLADKKVFLQELEIH